jgi:g-D-glutamyl-meso-diaminopimelate peptidase
MVGYVNHRICGGETLYQVAQRYGTQVRRIVAANRLLADRPLLPGQMLQVPLECPVVWEDGTFGSEVQELWLDGLQARCPWLEAEVLTHTAGGRPLKALRLGRGKRKVLMTAAHHGNEYITAILLWKLLETYCDAINMGGSLFGFSAQALFRGVTLYLVPLANPDGVDLVTGEILPCSEGYRRAAELSHHQPQVPFPLGWKANLQGVDLNLNYPAQWEQVRAVKGAKGINRPGPRDFPGHRPLDQPETRALTDLIRRIRPDAMAAWHTQGGEIYGKDSHGRYPDGDLAKRLSCASGYGLEDVPEGSRGGGLRDWFLQEFGKPAFTIEAGRGENPLPMTDLPQLLEENLPIFALLLAG